MKKILILLLFYSIHTYAFIDVESIRRDGLGLNGFTELTLSGASGNTSKLSSSLGSYLGYKIGKRAFLLIGEYNYSESAKVKDTQNGSIHFRLTQKISQKLITELYVQREFNDFKDLNSRSLFGVGLRRPLIIRVQTSIYAGISAFYENQELSSGIKEKLVRGNMYLSLVSSFDHFKLTTTSYYQPSLKSLKDFRLQLKFTLDFKLSEVVSFVVQASLMHDASPATSVKYTDINYLTGIKLRY